jgi:hypothetical protein
MNKTILYRLFRIGGIPKKLGPVLAEEGIEVGDEGIGGWFVTKNVKGPGKRYINRSEGFSGCLVVTRERIVCFTYGKRQINISIEDPKISEIYVDMPKANMLSISFESSRFRDGWSGVIEFLFKTEKAQQFHDALITIGAQQGNAPGGTSATLESRQ